MAAQQSGRGRGASRKAGGLVLFAVLAIGGAARPAQAARQVVEVSAGFPAGTIMISQHERKLYLLLGQGLALRYPIAIGKSGKAWQGWARVDGKYVNPAWSPPAEVKRDNPRMPAVIPGGAPNNPMGVRALTLDRDEIAIHGTTLSMRASVGTAASYGCIRMYNEDVVDLFDRVRVGTAVVAVP